MKKLFILLLTLCFLLCACGDPGSAEETKGTSGTSGSNGSSQSGESTTDIDADPDATIPAAEDMFTDRDMRTEYEDAAIIQLNGTSVSGDTGKVQVSDGTVTVTDEGTYVFRGELDGMIIVNADKAAKLQIVLDGVSIHSESSAALYVKQADKVFVTLSDGTENSLSSGESYTAIDENNINAAVYSRDDLTFNGTGSLTVSAPAGHGISSKDDLVFTGGSYSVTSASHALDANDSVRITNCAMTMAAGKDGIHAENTDDGSLGYVYIQSGSFDITAEGDGISAVSYLRIDDGTYSIVTGGGSENGSKQTSENWGGFGGGIGGGMGGGMGGGRPGMGGKSVDTTSTTTSTEDSTSIKGLKCSGTLTVYGGSFTLDCADDAIHSNSNVTIDGGTFQISTGDDGFHADETLTVANGTITVTESYEGLEGLTILITGGDITLTCSDDGINAAGGTDSSSMGGFRGNDMFGGMHGGSSKGKIEISGGSIYMNASGDGIDANGSLTISGGEVIVCGPTSGDTAVLDYDNSAVITGGTFIGTGAYQMAQTFSDSEQGVIALSVGNQAAGTKITVSDSSGNILISNEPDLSYAIAILSCPEMVKGESYTVSIGAMTETFEAS